MKQLIASIPMLALLAAGQAAAEQVQQKTQAQSQQQIQSQQQVRDQERVYGSQLMTEQEWREHQAKMHSFKTEQEREAYRKQHHEQMKARAQAKGLSLPDEPPAQGGGKGMGPMGPGQGSGPVPQRAYGSQLMTEQERREHRAKMRSFKTEQEREAYRKQHHEQMKARAQAKGLSLPDEPPAQGGGKGMGPGQGMGPGPR